MSSGFGPLSRSRLLGSDRPCSACTVSCVSSGVLSMPLPVTYCTLNVRPVRQPLRRLQRQPLERRVADRLHFEDAVEPRIDAARAVDRPAVGELPIGAPRLTSVTTGRLSPFA